jgi:hypothetical protein
MRGETTVAKQDGDNLDFDDLLNTNDSSAKQKATDPSGSISGSNAIGGSSAASTSEIFSQTGVNQISADVLSSLTDMVITSKSDVSHKSEEVATMDSKKDLARWDEEPIKFDKAIPVEELLDEEGVGAAPLPKGAKKQAKKQVGKQTGKQAGKQGKKFDFGSMKANFSWELGVVVLMAVLLLAMGFIGLIFLATAVYFIAISVISYTIWVERKTNTVYTVMLGCALAAAVTCFYCLWLELGRYNFDIGAKNAKSRVQVQSVQFEPTNTKAAA